MCTIGGNVNGVATMENNTLIPQKNKNRTTVWCRNSTSGYKTRENKETNLKRYYAPQFL